MDLNVRPETLKLLEENTLRHSISNEFLRRTLRAQEIAKIHKRYGIKLRSLCTEKELPE
jgi:hypothetical protein